MTGDNPTPDAPPLSAGRSRLVVLALLALGAAAGFASDAPSATGLAVLALAGVPVVFAVPPRGRSVVGGAFVVVALVVVLAGSANDDAMTWVAGASLVIAGAIMIWRGRRWPPLGRRYADGGAGGSDGQGAQAPVDLWRELDRGRDPTGDQERPEPPDLPRV